MTQRHPVHATLPYVGGAPERRALLGAMTFLEITDEAADPETIASWFEEHVVAAGCAPRPAIVIEPPIGCVPLRPAPRAEAAARRDLARVVSAARSNIASALRGLIATPSDDRFLREAIFLGRVCREGGHWVARLEPTAPLSSIVLALFAVAILSERSFYDQNLCVCEGCGRVSFDPRPVTRLSCPAHAQPPSGVAWRAARRDAVND